VATVEIARFIQTGARVTGLPKNVDADAGLT